MSTLISGGNGENGKVSVRGKDGTPLAELIASDKEAVVGAGNKKRPGRLTMYNTIGKSTVNLTAADATLTLGSNASKGKISGNEVNGKVSVRGKDGTPLAELIASDKEAIIGAGNKKRPGRLTMYSGAGKQSVNLTAANATLTLGGDALNGKVSVQGKDGQPLVELIGTDQECIIGLGQSGRPGRISIYGGDRNEQISLNGANGDIWIANADFAEDFDVSLNDIEPGTVMIITENGQLAPSSRAYDTCVAGVISGAGHYRPGMVLDRQRLSSERQPIALVGKVFCRVDATKDPIRVGDLLTTSDHPGHAMSARDPQRSFGAILGKALMPFAKGCGLIPILVTLQ